MSEEMDIDQEIEELQAMVLSSGKDTLLLEVLSILSFIREGYDEAVGERTYGKNRDEIMLQQKRYDGHFKLIKEIMNVYHNI